jgi:histidine triad (HIT) family protein
MKGYPGERFMGNENDTVFDRIISGEIPVEAVFENEDVLAFNDVNPQAPVHVLVIPKKRLSGFSELTAHPADVAGRFLKAVSQVAASLKLDENGYRVVINNGSDGGQEVEYLHAHILAGRKLKWPPG